MSNGQIAKDAGISAPTAKKWLSILVSSHIIALVQPYHNNILKRAVKQPLMHLIQGLALDKSVKSNIRIDNYHFKIELSHGTFGMSASQISRLSPCKRQIHNIY